MAQISVNTHQGSIKNADTGKKTSVTCFKHNSGNILRSKIKDGAEIYQLDSLVWLYYESGNWQNSSKEEYEFDDAGNLLTWITAYSDYMGGAWQNSSREQYQYNDNNLVTEDISAYWDSEANDWENSSRLVYSYADNNELSNITSSSWNTLINFWIPQYSNDYTYNLQGMVTQVIGQEWYYYTWRNYSRTDYEYNENIQEILSTSYTWNDEWVFSEKYEKEYDDNGNLILNTSYYWNAESGEWGNSYRNELQYDESENLIINTEFYWDSESNDWIGSSKTEFVYNKENQVAEKYVSYFDYYEHVWMYYDKYEYTYDFLGNIISSIYSNTGNTIWEKDIEWTPNTKTDYEYNTAYELSDLFVPPSFEYSTMITVVNQSIWNEEHWQDNYQGTYYYSLYVNTSIPNTTSHGLAVFPNPAADYIQMQWESEIPEYNLTIYNAASVQVFSGEVYSLEKIDVSLLPAGKYIFKFNNKLYHSEIFKSVIIQ